MNILARKLSGFIFCCRINVEGCRSVSLPTEAANQDVQDDLYKEFEKKYKIRQHIVPQVFQKAKIKKWLSIDWESSHYWL